MAHARSEHRNAITKLVNDKKIIMQKELARRLNKTDVKGTVEILVNEGKFKRDKIKVRLSSGGLMEQYVLYANKVKYDAVLDFEKDMINQPYESPLKEHHCYKKVNASINEGDGIRQIEGEILENNVVDMQEYVKINNVNLKIRNYEGVPVVTLQDIAELHEVSPKVIKENFKNNKKYLIEHEDYFSLTKFVYENFANEKLPRNYNATKEIILFTEQGYLLIVKSLTGEKAWEVQRNLVNIYFKMKEIQEKSNNNLPITQTDFKEIELMELMFKEMKNHKQEIINQNQRITTLENKLKLLAQ